MFEEIVVSFSTSQLVRRKCTWYVYLGMYVGLVEEIRIVSYRSGCVGGAHFEYYLDTCVRV